MEISKLWEGYEFPKCEQCKKDCAGHLKYDNLCSNLNYLQEYGEKNYIKNKESFVELKNIMGNKIPTIFSFGCGIGLDYIGAKEIFGTGKRTKLRKSIQIYIANWTSYRRIGWSEMGRY